MFKQRTVKKSSPGPKTRLGLIMVALGHAAKTAFSPNALVLSYGIELFSSAPIALIWINFAPVSRAARATFSAPRH